MAGRRADPPTPTSPDALPASTAAGLWLPKCHDGKSSSDDLILEAFRYTPIPTFILDDSLQVTHVSDSYCSVSGVFDRTNILGIHIDDLCTKVILPSNALVRQGILAARTSASPSSLKDFIGDKVWTLRTVPIIRNGTVRCFLMEVQDTTEAHRKQLELEERLYTNETFKILVDTVKDYAIFMLDPKGNIATWNAGAERFKGWTKSEIVGKHFSNFYPQEDRDNDKPGRELRDALRDGRVEDEGWRIRKDGSRFWANVVITPVYKGDVLLGFSKVTRDLSERKAAELKLISAYEEASKLKSEFMANMSHEIRSPMHGMLAALTLLLDTKLSPEQLDLARVIEESGEILLQVRSVTDRSLLVNDILDYSKLASGGFSISNDIISVPDIILSVYRAQRNISDPKVLMETDIDPKLPISAEGDSLRYRQIVQNLLSNAIKFTEEGYVRIRATVRDEDEACYTILTEVADSGIGVPAFASDSLFTPFTQFDNSATKRYKGTGLGLSICKSLAHLMGGDIGFRANPEGKGSIFWFTAKLKKVAHLPRVETLNTKLSTLSFPAAPPPSFAQLKPLAQNAHILLAEDNPINRKVMLKMLSALGFCTIDVANDGNEAVAKCLAKAATRESEKCGYDLILMDVNMPFCDGVQATKQIRAAGSVDTPIFALTANALKGQAESYVARGMTGFISKPVDRRVLVETLLGVLRGNDEGSVKGLEGNGGL